MKQLTKVLPFLALVFLVSACSSSKIMFENKLKEGKTFNMEKNVVSNVEFEMMGMAQSIEQNIMTVEKYEVKDVMSNGNTVIVQTPTRYKLSNNNPMMFGPGYDSDDENSENEGMAAAFGSMLNQPIEFTLNKKGEVVTVKGVDELREKVMSNLGDDMMGQALKAQMKETLTVKAKKDEFAQMFNFRPAAGVKVGDTWTIEESKVGDYNLDGSTIYTLTKVEDGKAYLDVSGSLSTVDDGSGQGANMKGTQKGMMVVDLASSFIVSSNLVQDLSGEVSQQGMTMPLKAKNTISIETK